MGKDDDEDCPEHVWVLEEVVIGRAGGGADTGSVCARCGTARYEPGQAALGDTRPPL